MPKAQKGNLIITAAPFFHMNFTLIGLSDEKSFNADG